VVDDAGDDAVVVAGTGHPEVDVPAVQAAVDRGGAVILTGHFSFDAPATRPVAPALASAAGGYAPTAEVLIAKGVSITGSEGDDGGMTTIDGGTIPFYVDAAGQRVTIRGLRFVRPTSNAILVYAVHGVAITGLRIEGVVTFAGAAEGIGINTSGGPPNLVNPGHPENVSGPIFVTRNDIDIGGTAHDATLGISVISVGTSGADVDAHVFGNSIKNTTAPAIDFRRIGGRAEIVQNMITTGLIAGRTPRPQAIRAANTGSYLIAHNYIDCQWATPDAEAIGVFSQVATWPVEGADVRDNQVYMSAPASTVFTDFSAGVGVYGYALNNMVRHNTIRGAARAGLAIPVFPLRPQAPAAPRDNAFISNRFVHFTPSVADFFIGAHAIGTRIVGLGSVDDQGTATIIQRTGSAEGAERRDHSH
jgi:hypothetical protein